MGKRVVVGGAGFGGLAAAFSLARLSPDVEVVLVDAERSHVYTPWLYEVATGFLFASGRKARTLLRRGARVPYEEILKYAPKNIRFRQGRVSKIDTTDKHLLFEDGMTLRFDVVILAFGSEEEDYGIPGVKLYGMPLKSIADGMRIEERLKEDLEALREGKRQEVRVVIGGAGAAGVETAAELAQYLHACTQHHLCPSGVSITLIDAAAHLLGMFPSALRERATKRAKQIGIRLRLSARITQIDADIIRTDAGSIPYDIFIWTGGIRPNRLTALSDLMRDPRGRLLADRYGCSQERKDIFVLGDGALLTDPSTGKPVPPAAWAAMREGRQVGENVARLLAGKSMKPLVFPRMYPAIVTVGGHYSVATILGVSFSGFFAFVLRRLVDFHYFFSILPFSVAIRFWWRGAELFENNNQV